MQGEYLKLVYTPQKAMYWLRGWSVMRLFFPHSYIVHISIHLLRRPRINKLDSVKDREQKSSGNYFFVEGGDGDDANQ